MEGSVGHRILAAEEKPREVLVLGRWPGWLGLLRWIIMLALAAAVIYGGLQLRSFLQASAPKPPSRPSVERSFPVDTIIVKRETVTPTIISYGEVVPGRTVDLRALVSGEVTSVSPNLVEGGRVKAGETLLKVDTFAADAALVRARSEKIESEARQAETAARIISEEEGLKRASEQQDIADREVQRIESLRRTGSASTSQLDAAKLRRSSAAQAVDQRRNAILVLEAQAKREAAPIDRLAFAIANAERDIANSALKAPFTGIISNAGAEMGRLLSPNDRVATLVTTEAVDVRFSLGDAQFGRLVKDGRPIEGRKVTAIWRSGGSQFQSEGVISRVAPLANAREGGFDLYARLETGAALSTIWRPGAFVEVRLEDQPLENVIRLPQSALFPGGIVYPVDKEGRLGIARAEARGFDGADILVGADMADGAELLSTRLSEAGPGVLVKPRGRAAAGKAGAEQPAKALPAADKPKP